MRSLARAAARSTSGDSSRRVAWERVLVLLAARGAGQVCEAISGVHELLCGLLGVLSDPDWLTGSSKR